MTDDPVTLAKLLAIAQRLKESPRRDVVEVWIDETPLIEMIAAEEAEKLLTLGTPIVRGQGVVYERGAIENMRFIRNLEPEDPPTLKVLRPPRQHRLTPRMQHKNYRGKR